jgi:hypothetical protein
MLPPQNIRNGLLGSFIATGSVMLRGYVPSGQVVALVGLVRINGLQTARGHQRKKKKENVPSKTSRMTRLYALCLIVPHRYIVRAPPGLYSQVLWNQ